MPPSHHAIHLSRPSSRLARRPTDRRALTLVSDSPDILTQLDGTSVTLLDGSYELSSPAGEQQVDAECVLHSRVSQRAWNERFKFENSGVQELCDSTGESPAPADDYFNAQPPERAILKESPSHRAMIILRTTGHSIKEIADALGYSEIHVGNVLRQPWARKRILEAQNDSLANEVRKTVERAGRKALTLLEESLDDVELPANVRSQTAQYLVNRLLGKPSASLVVDDRRDPNSLTTEELAALLAS